MTDLVSTLAERRYEHTMDLERLASAFVRYVEQNPSPEVLAALRTLRNEHLTPGEQPLAVIEVVVDTILAADPIAACVLGTVCGEMEPADILATLNLIVGDPTC